MPGMRHCLNCGEYDECYYLATPCANAEAASFDGKCYPYFNCCDVARAVDEYEQTVFYFEHLGTCWQLDSDDDTLDPEDVATMYKSGYVNLISGAEAGWGNCSACIAENDSWLKFSMCDCSDAGHCDYDVYFPSNGDIYDIGDCSNDCFEDQPCLFYLDYRLLDDGTPANCCLSACNTDVVTSVPSCCEIIDDMHTTAWKKELEDCETTDGQPNSGGHWFRGCCSCCNLGTHDYSPCEVFKGMSTYQLTYVLERDDVVPLTSSLCHNSFPYTITINFLVDEDGGFTEADDWATMRGNSCAILDMGASVAVPDCETGEPTACHASSPSEPMEYGQWNYPKCCLPVIAAEAADTSSCPDNPVPGGTKPCGYANCTGSGGAAMLWSSNISGFRQQLGPTCGDGTETLASFLGITIVIAMPSWNCAEEYPFNCTSGDCSSFGSNYESGALAAGGLIGDCILIQDAECL
jgi:hypothetical protein